MFRNLTASSLREVKGRIRALFTQERVAVSAGLFLDGLQGYVLGVSATHQFHSWGRTPAVPGTAESIAGSLDASAWQRLSAGPGTKGARLCDWACLELADLDAGEFNKALSGTWTRGLLIRRSLADGKLAFFATWCPAGTGAAKLVQVEGCRWAIDLDQLGDCQDRAWPGPQRKPLLARLAPACVARHARLRHGGQHTPSRKPAGPTKNPPRLPRTRLPQAQARGTQARQPSSAGRSRNSAASPHAWPKPASSPRTPSHGRSGDARTKPSHSAAI